jgi:dephospho-CoA kinase
LTAAIVITGAPGSGKSSVAQAFTTLLDNAGIEHGAIESEQLAWGTPWLSEALVHEQLAVVLSTDGRAADDVAAELYEAYVNGAGWGG